MDCRVPDLVWDVDVHLGLVDQGLDGLVAALLDCFHKRRVAHLICSVEELDYFRSEWLQLLYEGRQAQRDALFLQCLLALLLP